MFRASHFYRWGKEAWRGALSVQRDTDTEWEDRIGIQICVTTNNLHFPSLHPASLSVTSGLFFLGELSLDGVRFGFLTILPAELRWTHCLMQVVRTPCRTSLVLTQMNPFWAGLRLATLTWLPAQWDNQIVSSLSY